jgi:hypothetical protein
MFSVNYNGKLGMLGAGRYTSNFMARRSVIQIGPTRLRNVLVSDYIDSALEADLDRDSDISVSVGWAMFFRWVLAIKHQGEVIREGFFLFFAGLLTHLVVVGLTALLGGALLNEIAPALGYVFFFGVGLYGLVSLGLNVKAWLFP